jgi:methyl-accepting chemotaxis protein
LKEVNAILQNRSGMGESGESYLVGQDYRMRSDSFLDPQNYSVTASFKHDNLAKSEMIEKALQGQSGTTIGTDYTGGVVLSNYRPFEVLGTRWALVSEINEDEAMAVRDKIENQGKAGLNTIVQSSVGISVLFILIGLGVSYYIGHGFAQTTGFLAGCFERFSKGRLEMSDRDTQEVETLKQRSDEFGDMVTSADGLRRYLESSAEVAQHIAAGNLRVDVQKAGDDDAFGVAFENMVQSLNDAFSEIMMNIEQIAIGSQQVSEASQSLSQGATEQASSIEEISASMTEMSDQTRRSAENAGQTEKIASNTRDAGQTGSDKMQHLVSQMGELSEAADQINSIIKTIDEIAFQTNLLALNAAVEAARAGQHGKGFAVVAEEVRNLAGRSATAAKETADLIVNVVEKIASGNDMSKESSAMLREIVEYASQVVDLAQDVSSGANEQAKGVSEATEGIRQVDEVTQQNTANSEETASAAEELQQQATSLRELVSRFQLKQQTAAQAPAPTGHVSSHQEADEREYTGAH